MEYWVKLKLHSGSLLHAICALPGLIFLKWFACHCDRCDIEPFPEAGKLKQNHLYRAYNLVKQNSNMHMMQGLEHVDENTIGQKTQLKSWLLQQAIKIGTCKSSPVVQF